MPDRMIPDSGPEVAGWKRQQIFTPQPATHNPKPVTPQPHNPLPE